MLGVTEGACYIIGVRGARVRYHEAAAQEPLHRQPRQQKVGLAPLQRHAAPPPASPRRRAGRPRVARPRLLVYMAVVTTISPLSNIISKHILFVRLMQFEIVRLFVVQLHLLMDVEEL